MVFSIQESGRLDEIYHILCTCEGPMDSNGFVVTDAYRYDAGDVLTGFTCIVKAGFCLCNGVLPQIGCDTPGAPSAPIKPLISLSNLPFYLLAMLCCN